MTDDERDQLLLDIMSAMGKVTEARAPLLTWLNKNPTPTTERSNVLAARRQLDARYAALSADFELLMASKTGFKAPAPDAVQKIGELSQKVADAVRGQADVTNYIRLATTVAQTVSALQASYMA